MGSSYMEQIMKKLKQILKSVKEKTGFYQGMAVGLVITSTLSYAVVTLTSFTAGTPISSTDMNANFAVIKAKLDNLDVGMSGKLTADVAVVTACASTMPLYPSGYVILPMAIDTTDGNYNPTTFIYTIPKTAIYRLFYPAQASPIFIAVEISIDGGTTWSQMTTTTDKLSAGTQLRVLGGCGNFGSLPQNVLASSFLFMIKLF